MKLWYEENLKKLFYIWLFSSFIIFTFLIPPFQKPDEINHFLRATALAKGEIFCKRDNTGKMYFLIPFNFYNLPDQMSANILRYKYNEKFPLYELIQQRNKDNHSIKEIGICFLPFTGYLSNVIGISVGLLFNNPLLAFYLGRMSAGIIFILSILFALKIIPSGYKLLVYLYSFIPMVMYQATAISYDTLQLSIMIILFSVCLKYLLKEVISKKELVLFLILLAFFILVKSGYYPMLLLYFIFPYKKITNKFRYYFIFTLLLSAVGLIFTFLSARVTLSSTPSNHFINPLLQVNSLIHNPSILIHIFFNSLKSYGDFYYQSFIGYFGWLDFKLNYFIYEAYTVLIAGVIFFLIQTNKRSLLNKFQILLLFFIIISTTFIIFVSQYLSWSPVGSPVIHGVQGRYFLVILPLFIFAITQFAINIGKRNFYTLLEIGFIAFLFIDILFNIYNRYFNYNNIYANENALIKPFKILNSSSKKQIISLKTNYKFYLPVSSKKTIDGFTVILSTSKKGFSNIYTYVIRDATCKNTLRYSAFNTNELKNNQQISIYEEKFKAPIEAGNKKLCIFINPLSDTKTTGYINIYSLNDNILFEPIYNR